MRVMILGGGGTLGAFSAGALAVLDEAGWSADAMIGSSAGSINLLRAYAGGPAASADFWLSLHWARLLWEGVRTPRSGILDEDRFHARVDERVSYDAMLHDRRFIGFLVVDLCTGRVKIRGNRTEATAEDLRQVAHASYSLPPLFPPVLLHGQVLSDGGLLYNAPLDAAIELGASEIVYLCNVHVVPSSGFPPTMRRAMTRYAEIFARRASNVGFADAEIREGAYRGARFLAITPPPTHRLGPILGRMLPRHSSMQALIERGRAMAEHALAQAQWASHPEGIDVQGGSARRSAA
ncbi:patatin-like phospholipase family protein [Chondromyces crocatus]|uniref:PNPLA domain-containing protein n=1 Tax=Chondromyces crocatus TaxID=52 RepID=A0A0K1EP43_CHOCO|nr:patatin-like phospholipase family protein [Chondromyces crocatus]AKT42685.1 uncharacterized protein CMC5_069120 [Chondromyces crocatus]